MRIKRIGHVALRVVDEQRSRHFYRDILGFDVSEEDPEHGGVFMTLGDNFHTIDVFGHPDAANAPQPNPNQVGLFHIAFEVGSYGALKDAYCALVENEVPISHCVDHISQRSIYFADPDGNRLENLLRSPERPQPLPRGPRRPGHAAAGHEEGRAAARMAGRGLARTGLRRSG